MAAIFGRGGGDYSAVGSPGRSLSRGDCPRRDRVTMEVHRYSMQWRNLGFNISIFQMAYKLTHQTSQSENIQTKSKDTLTKH